MLRLLHLSDTFSYGGTEKTMQILCAALQKRGVDVHAGAWVGGGQRETWLRQHVKQVVSFTQNAEALRAYIAQHGITIVHVHRSNHGTVELLRILRAIPGIRVVETNAFGKITDDPIELTVAARLFVSRFCADRFRVQHPQITDAELHRTTAVLYNPIDPADFPSYSESAVEAFRTSLGIAVDEHVISRVGRADNKKFGDMCVRMLPYFLKRNPRVRVVLQSAPARIKRFVRRHGLENRVIVLPETASTEELGLLYAATDVMIHSALVGETFGCSMAEAMLYRVPVVVNATPYFDNAQIEVVDNARTGYVVDNPLSFAHATEALLRDTAVRAQYGESGRTKVLEQYAVDVVTNELERIYEQVVAGEPVGNVQPNELSIELEKRGTHLYQPRPLLFRLYRFRNILQKRFYALRDRISL